MAMKATTVAALAALATAAPGNAQVIAEFRAGADWSSVLVTDVIAEEFTVQPAIAPSLGLAVGTPLGPKYEVALDVRWARSDLKMKQADSSRTIIPLTVWSGFVVLRWRLQQRWLVQAGVGAVKYDPSEDGRESTMFRDDQPLRAAVGLAARGEYPVSRSLRVGIDLGWSVHGFTTQALREEGFDTRIAHRVSLAAVLRWSNEKQ